MIRLLLLAALTLGVSTLTSTNVSAQDAEETITATVTSQEVSMTVTPTTIDYGTVAFETSRSSLAAEGGPITFSATNTGNVDADFLVKGTNATGSGFSWDLQDTAPFCPGSPATNHNKFRHSVTPEGGSGIFLTVSDVVLDDAISPASSMSFNSEIYMPCFGSGGAGLQATTQIVLTAVEAIP